MKKYAITPIICILMVCAASCEAWLDVKPKKMVEEEDLFNRETGFKEALTGVYIKMASTSLYSKTLSYGFIDILGQRYQLGGVNTGYQDPLYYTFPSTYTESTTNSIWSNMYNLIANVNNLLHWIDVKSHVFSTPDYYEIIKGEALGLRAFLHFDLLRMFGPVYKENPAAASIPYRSQFNLDLKELLPANAVADSIIRDLKEAETILTGHDPLLFEFPKTLTDEANMKGDRFLVYRHKRMNLYAVQAMLARVYMYIGNKAEAARYAHQVVDSGQFEMISDNTVDRIFSKEIIFSIYVDKFENQVLTEFTSNGGKLIIYDRSFLDEMFDVANDGGNDIRLREGVGFDYDAFSAATRKYKQDNLWESIEGTVPLIRLPEMYYILAECEDDYARSAAYLNIVRNARGIEETAFNNSDAKRTEIEKEYRKEFYVEVK